MLMGGAPVAVVTALLATGRIPRWLCEFQVNVNRWNTRALAYLLLLTDSYPRFDGEHPASYQIIVAPRVSRRRIVVWKLISAIPHGLMLAPLVLLLVPLTAIGWFVALVRGSYPAVLHRYGAGVLRWNARLQAYLLSLVDEYPPFSLRSDAATSPVAAAAGSGVGVTLAGLAVAALAALVAFGGERSVATASYEGLLTREASVQAEVISANVVLHTVNDPFEQQPWFLQAEPGKRIVSFSLNVTNQRPGSPGDVDSGVPVRSGAFSLVDSHGATHAPILVLSGGRPAPASIDLGQTEAVLAYFELPEDVLPSTLAWDVLDYISFPRVGETIVFEFR